MKVGFGADRRPAMRLAAVRGQVQNWIDYSIADIRGRQSVFLTVAVNIVALPSCDTWPHLVELPVRMTITILTGSNSILKPPPSLVKTPASTAEPVLLIHGTFANQLKLDSMDWWQPGSAFCSELDAALAAQGSAARCWAKHNGQLEPFAWSGANLESERCKGGRALAEMITGLESDLHIHRYHLIAHSHGGNVLLNAMEELDEAPRKLGAVIMMGTPVLSISHRLSLNSSWMNWLTLTAALAFGVWQLVVGSSDTQPYAVAAIFAVAAAMVLEYLRQHYPSLRKSVYGSGHPHAFAFLEDEAIQGLINASQIIRQPRRFIRQFLAAEKPRPFAVTPRNPPASREWRMYQRSGAYVLMKALYDNLNNQSASSSQLMGGLGNKPVVIHGDAQSELAQKIAKLVGLFPVQPLQWMALGALIACVALPLLLFGSILLPMALLKRLWDRCKRLLATMAAG